MMPHPGHPSVLRSGRRSVTLLELLVVVVLLGLAATGVSWNLRDTTDAARLRGATLQVEQTLRQARHVARTRYRAVWLQLEPGSGRYRLALAGAEADDLPPWRMLAGVTIEQAVVGETQVAPRGQPLCVRITPTGASLPWTLTLRAGTARRVITTDGISGCVQVRDDSPAARPRTGGT